MVCDLLCRLWFAFTFESLAYYVSFFFCLVSKLLVLFMSFVPSTLFFRLWCREDSSLLEDSSDADEEDILEPSVGGSLLSLPYGRPNTQHTLTRKKGRLNKYGMINNTCDKMHHQRKQRMNL